MAVRLNKALKELNVGINTVAEFLQKKGAALQDATPNAKITDEQYALLMKEFGTRKNFISINLPDFIEYKENEQSYLDNFTEWKISIFDKIPLSNNLTILLLDLYRVLLYKEGYEDIVKYEHPKHEYRSNDELDYYFMIAPNCNHEKNTIYELRKYINKRLVIKDKSIVNNDKELIYSSFEEVSLFLLIRNYKEIIMSIINRILIAASQESKSDIEYERYNSTTTQFILKYIKEENCVNVYNPYAGYGRLSDGYWNYFGQEDNELLWVLGRIIADDANGIVMVNCSSIDNFCWSTSEKYDCIVSNLSKYAKSRSYFSKHKKLVNIANVDNIQHYSDYNFEHEKQFFYKAINKNKANLIIGVVNRSFLQSRYTYLLRKYLVRNNLLSHVIMMSNDIDDLGDVIIILKRDKKNDNIYMVDASEIIQANISKNISTEDFIKNYCYYDIVNRNETIAQKYSFIPYFYIDYPEPILKGETVELKDICSYAIPEHFDIMTVGTTIKDFPSCPNMDTYLKIHIKSKNNTYCKRDYCCFNGDFIIIYPSKGKLHIIPIRDAESFFFLPKHLVSSGKIAVIRPNLSIISDMDYLAYILYNSIEVKLATKCFFRGDSVPGFFKLLLDTMIIPVEKNIGKQKNIIDNEKNKLATLLLKEYKNRIDMLGVRQATSDISHMLKDPFRIIKNNLDYLVSEINNDEWKESLLAVLDGYKYTKRIIDSVGADFSLGRFNPTEEYVVQFMENYITSWKRLEMSVFDILIEYKTDIATTMLIDTTMLQITLDTIFRNAYQHAFLKKMQEGNIVFVNISSCEIMTQAPKKFVKISVCNNGVPMPENFTVEDFISKGRYSGTNGNTGLGGYHIYTIIRRHNGFINIRKDDEYNFIIDLLIPIEMYNETEKFEEYGYKIL